MEVDYYMRLKYGTVLIMIIIVVLAGCARKENAAGIMEDQSSVGKEDNYYKISVSDAELDYREIISGLTGSSWDGSSEGSVDIDGIQHSWMIGDKTFTYRNNRENGTVNEADARKTADDCVKSLNLDVELNTAPSCTKEQYLIQHPD